MPEECSIVRNHEGFLVNTCTGEVIEFDNYEYQDYSNLEYYERVSSLKKRERKRANKEIKDTKKIVLNYLLSIMSEEEKDKFYRILNEIEKHRKPDAALYLAIYEYIITKEGKVLSRDYIKFLKMKGVGKYAIRQKKKLLRKILKEDPVIQYINSLDQEKREEALKIYEILKKKNLIYGRAETRKKILMEYLSDAGKKKELLEEHYVEELIRWNFHYVMIFLT
jgi:hypothetical protein